MGYRKLTSREQRKLNLRKNKRYVVHLDTKA
jgi:hypothetical protein